MTTPTLRNYQNLRQEMWRLGRFVCVGFDPDMAKIPECVKNTAGRYAGAGTSQFRLTVVDFCRQIVLATRGVAGAYKPNSAFFEEHGADGMKTLTAVVHTINELAPDVPIVGDLKRADIGNTNRGYAKAAFKALGVDTVTVNPYFGGGSLAPFFNFEDELGVVRKGDKGVVVLCRTSNPEAAEFQDRLTLISQGEIREEFSLLAAAGVTTFEKMLSVWPTATMNGESYWVMPFYQWVAIRFASRWNGNGNCSLVVGATAPQELANVRALVGDMPLLIPGIGFQQRDVPLEQQVEQAVKAAMDSRGQGFYLNDSRGTLYASSGQDFAEAALARVTELNRLVAKYRS